MPNEWELPGKGGDLPGQGGEASDNKAQPTSTEGKNTNQYCSRLQL